MKTINKMQTHERMKTIAITRRVNLMALLFACAPAFGQVFTLDSVLRTIDRRNPMLQEYDLRAKAQRAYTEGAKSWMAPMIGAGTFMTPYPGQTADPSSAGSLMISVEQNIPNPARQSANERFYASRAAVEEQSRLVRFNNLRSEAKKAYYRWLVAEEKLRILRESEELIQLMLKIARIRYPYNQGSLGAIYKTEGRLHEVQNMTLMTQGEIEEAAFTLRAVMNLPADTPIRVDTATRVRFERATFLSDTASLRSQRSDVRQLEKTIEVMRLNQELQQYQSKPEFRFRFDHMQPYAGGMPSQFTAMAMVSIPIAPWSSRMYKSEVKGMQHDIDAMKRGQEAVLVEAKGMLAGMAMLLTRMEQQLENYRTRILPALRKNHQAAQAAYEENRESLPTVVDGWEALNMAQLAYTDRLAEYYEMIVRYEKEAER